MPSRPQRRREPQGAAQQASPKARGEEAQWARRRVGSNRVEGPVVHRGQQLGRSELCPLGVAHLHRPTLLRPWLEAVAEGRKGHLELAIGPRHAQMALDHHQLVVAQRRQAQRDTTPFALGHRKLDPSRRRGGHEVVDAFSHAAAEDLEAKRKTLEPGMDQNLGHSPDLDARRLQPEHQGQRQRFGLAAGHDQISIELEGGAKRVGGGVAQSIRPSRQRRQSHRRQPILPVIEVSLCHQLSGVPAGEHDLGSNLALPPRPLPVAGGFEMPGRSVLAKARTRYRRGLDGRCRSHQPAQSPGASARARRAIEVGTANHQGFGLRGGEEVPRGRDRRFDRHEAEAHRPRRRARFTAGIGDVGVDPEAPRQSLFAGPALVGGGLEADHETTVRTELGLAARHDFRASGGRRGPPPPPRPHFLARHPVAHRARRNRQAKGVPRLPD